MKKIIIGLLAFGSVLAYAESNVNLEYELNEGETLSVLMSSCPKAYTKKLTIKQQTESIEVKAECQPILCLTRDYGWMGSPRYTVYLSTTSQAIAVDIKKGDMDATLTRFVREGLCAKGIYYIWPKEKPHVIE